MKLLNKKNLTSALIGITFACISTTAYAERKYLFTWDDGENTNFSGWTWSADVAYGHPGWTLNPDGPFDGGKNYSWGYGPRNFELGGDSGGALASIDLQNRAPSTSVGGSLKIYDDDTTNHYPGWWIWYDVSP